MKPKQLHRLKAKGRRLVVRIIPPDSDDAPYTAIVGSNSNSVFNHVVTVKFRADGTISARCTCPWAEHGGIACSHVIAALSKLAERKKRTLSFWPTREDAERQKHAVFSLVSNLSSDRIYITSRRTL